MSEHIAACLLASLALLGAFLHHRILGKFLALLAAAVARLGAGGTDEVGVRSHAGSNTGGGRAMSCAVRARLKRLHVLLFALRNHVGAVCGAGVAHTLAIVAGLGACLKSRRIAI